MPDIALPFTASVDLAPLGAGVVSLTLDADHRLWIERPAAWGGSHVVPAERYQWRGGVPDPADPGIPPIGPHYGADDLAWKDPVLGTVRAAAPNTRETPEQRTAAKAEWARLWRLIAPALNARAATLASTYEYTADLYQALATRPDLCDHLTVCPVLGPFLTPENAAQIPATGWNLQRITAHLLTPARPGAEPPALAPGFMAWARGMKWESNILPAFPRTGDKRVPAMRGFIRTALQLGKDLDPNGIQKLKTDDEWLVVNLALSTPATARMLPVILKNPEAAVASIGRYLPPEVRVDKRTRIDTTFGDVVAWRQAHPQQAAAITGFNRLCEEAKRWDRGNRAQDHEAEERRAVARAARAAAREAEAAAAVARAAEIAEQARLRGATWTLRADIDPIAPFPNPPAETVYEEGSYLLHYLGTGVELQQESLLLNHCVVTYADKAHQGTCRIYSVRKVSDPATPIATIETNRANRVVQERGPRNAALSDTLKAWVRRAVAHVSGTLPEDEPAAVRRRRAADAVAAGVDGDAPEVEAIEVEAVEAPAPRPRGARRAPPLLRRR